MFVKSRKWIGMSSTIAVLAGQFLIMHVSVAAGSSVIEEGKAIAFDRKKGNCLACHMITGGNLPGNIAPPLIAMKGRYTNKEDLRKQIWDPTIANPESSMPPFGKHEVLTKAELDKVVEFIWSL
ncbi:MAG: sulfur oxidation c-type cytochrome SoxX [Gammaproteobacteria bacterium]|nr:sulfur oxidation c-type cytochrome SoxX [Gammaproteobacteria bacterium]